MATYLYSRVSTDKQTVDNQLAHLKARYPDAAVFEETASGIKARPVLNALLGLLKEGDTLVIAALDRLGRRTVEILTLIEGLDKRGVILKSEREGIDYSTPVGRLIVQVLCSMAELERNLISERTKAALAAKRAKGIVGGRRPKFAPEVVAKVKELRAQGQTMAAISKATGVSTSRVFQLLKASAVPSAA